MLYRDFPDFDLATETNVRSLKRLADQDGQPGDFDLIDNLVCSAIATIKRLPPAIGRHFILAEYLIGGATTA